VSGILSIATVKPGFAGLVSEILNDLRPVGGIEASFERCVTFGKAVEAVLDNSKALDSIIEIRVSDSEIYKNDHGRATIEYLSGDTKKTANYVGKLAVSLLQPGAEKTFDPRRLISSVITETVFYPLDSIKVYGVPSTQHNSSRVGGAILANTSFTLVGN
jgi:hypothetical protein